MMSYLRRLARRLHTDDVGAMSVEKIMIIALISLPIIIALWVFRSQLIKWFKDQSNSLSPDVT